MTNAPRNSEIEVPGGTLAVRDHGDPTQTRHVPVLLHGIGYSLDVWAEVADLLAARTRVVSVDLRGHGQSTATSSSADDAWRDLLVLVRELGLERPVFVGHDFGAYLATAAEASAPGTAGAVVAVDWPTPLPPEEARAWAAEVTSDDLMDFLTDRFMLGATGPDEASREEFLTRLMDAVGKDWITAETGEQKARTGLARSLGVHEDGSWVRRPTREEVVTQARMAPDSPVFPDATLYDRITCPLWFVHAEDGPYADVLPRVEEICRAGEGRRLVVLEAGHHVEQTHPDQVAHVLGELLTSLED